VQESSLISVQKILKKVDNTYNPYYYMKKYGRLAQGLERLRDMQKASGSIPLSPSVKEKRLVFYIYNIDV
jgi:hypothetical protein